MLGNQTKDKNKMNTVTFKKSPVKYELFDSTSHSYVDTHDESEN